MMKMCPGKSFILQKLGGTLNIFNSLMWIFFYCGTLSHSFNTFVFLTLFTQTYFIWALELIEMSWVKFIFDHFILIIPAGSIFRTQFNRLKEKIPQERDLFYLPLCAIRNAKL